jgi:hypothetical protein
MQHQPTITEIWERTEQGMTRPYRCGADDGNSYYVKSSGAGWRSLVCEWLAGCLAQRLNLPVPPFAQVVIEDEFAAYMASQGDNDLAAGFAFGSQIAVHTHEFEPSLVARCNVQFRRDLVAFDWWVRNADRSLSALAGNPNLLWSSATQAPVVIDHNMAFDRDFDAALFLQTHVFRADFAAIASDMLLRADYEQRFEGLLADFATIWSEVPQNWIIDEDCKSRFDREQFLAVLRQVQKLGFWV